MVEALVVCLRDSTFSKGFTIMQISLWMFLWERLAVHSQPLLVEIVESVCQHPARFADSLSSRLSMMKDSTTLDLLGVRYYLPLFYRSSTAVKNANS